MSTTHTDPVAHYTEQTAIIERRRAARRATAQIDERAEFEAWFRNYYRAMPRHLLEIVGGTYAYANTRRQWLAWQARAALEHRNG